MIGRAAAILFLSAAGTFLSAIEYDMLRLKAQSRIFPKILQMRTYRAEVRPSFDAVSILYSRNDREVALQFRDWLEETFESMDKRKTPQVLLCADADISCMETANTFMVLWMDTARLYFAADFALRRHIPTFCYDPGQLKYGFLFSLSIEKNVNIYANKDVIGLFYRDFDPALFRLLKVVETN